jgi:allantoinase
MKRLEATQLGEETGRFDEAWGGIASLSIALPLLWTECERRSLSLRQLSEWTSAAPARLAGLSTEVGSIEPGKHANLVAFDTAASFTVAPELLHYRHAISPYMGETLRGVVRSTWLRGERVFQRDSGPGEFSAAARGREYALSCSLT